MEVFRVKRYSWVIWCLLIIVALVRLTTWQRNPRSRQPKSDLPGAAGGSVPASAIFRSVVKIRYTAESGRQVQQFGSGVLFSSDGLVITNNHVIEERNFGLANGKITGCVLSDMDRPPDCKYTAEVMVRISPF
jgi:S1-C subfamily serine protease